MCSNKTSSGHETATWESTAAVIICTRPTQGWALQHFILGSRAHEAPPLPMGLLAVKDCWRRKCHFFFSGITTGKVALDPVNNLLPKLLQEPIIQICGSFVEDMKAGGRFGGSGGSAGEGGA